MSILFYLLLYIRLVYWLGVIFFTDAKHLSSVQLHGHWQGVVGAEIRGSVAWNELCPNYKALGSAYAVLDDGHMFSAKVRSDGQFLLADISEGDYILSIQAHDHLFEQMFVRSPGEGENATKVLPHIPGTVLSTYSPPLPYPIKISAVSRHNFFVPHESFNLFAMFGNPMMLMMLVGAVLVFATPYLAKSLDPEALKEIQDKSSRLAVEQKRTKGGEEGRRDDTGKPSTKGRQTGPSTISKSRNTKSRRK